MKTGLILPSLILCLIISQGAWAQGFSQGDNMIKFSGSGSSDNDLDNTSFGTEFAFGHFCTDILAFEVRQGLNLVDVPGSEGDWGASTRIAADLYCDLERFWPFVGLNLGYLYGDIVNDTWVAGPEGGLKIFVNETTYLFGLVEYEFFFDESDEVDEAFDDGRFVYSMGVGFKF